MNFKIKFFFQFFFLGLLQLNFAFLDSKDSTLNPHSVLKKNVPISVAFRHKDTEEFVKRLEYASVNSKAENSLDYGLTPLDLNLLPDGLFAEEVAEGVEDELAIVDAEIGDVPLKDESAKIIENSQVNHGVYEPSPEYNSFIDDLIVLTKGDVERRKMDPLYFTIHPRGIVRHAPQNITSLTTSAADFGGNKSDDAVGGGIIEGLLKLKRFGNAESRPNGDKILVRSHYFFGPLKISLAFESKNGLRSINSTLSAWAAHALHVISTADNSTTLSEFITDNPMEYEIRLRGSKNPRFRTLSQSAITRLFKRNGRMEVRLLRSFKRTAEKSTKNATKVTIKSQQQTSIGRLKAGNDRNSNIYLT